MTERTANTPLTGLKILDLADEKAAFCSKLLADLGATVIKIEKPGGDRSRWFGPFLGNRPGPHNSLLFSYNNTGKLGITLDLEHSDGRGIFLRLAGQTDAIVETFPPGYLDEIGLDYDTISKHNRSLILASITGFGQDGTRKSWKSSDIIASAVGGQMYVTGAPDTPPLKAYGQQPSYIGSLNAAIGILTALRARHSTGIGQHIDISLQESVVSSLEHVMVRYFSEDVVPNRQGNLHWNNSACTLPCKDGNIFVTFNREWEALINWLDSEGMAADLKEDRWNDEAYRTRHGGHIIDVLTQWTMSHDSQELIETAQLMRFPWAPVNTPRDVYNSSQLLARDFFTGLEQTDTNIAMPHPMAPYKFNGESVGPTHRPPTPGEHNKLIYHDQLGISLEELEELSATNTI